MKSKARSVLAAVDSLLRQRDERSDGELLRAFLDAKSEDAFSLLVRRHGAMVVGVCRRILDHIDDADDAAQATFLVLATKAKSLTAYATIGGWLHEVARRTAFRARRGDRRRQKMERNFVPPAKTDRDEFADLLPILDEEVARLPDKYRLPIVLCDLEGQSRKAAAARLRWPEGTVAGRLTRARKVLVDRLTKRGVSLPAGALAAALTSKPATASLTIAAAKYASTACQLLANGSLVNVSSVSAKVVALTQGVLKTMLLSQLRFFATAVVLSLGFFCGVGYVAREAALAQSGQIRKEPDKKAIGEQSDKTPPTPQRKPIDDPWEKEPTTHEEAHALAAKTPGFKNLITIGLAFHSYHDFFLRFPPAVLHGPDGKTPYSWRVELLPHLQPYHDNIDWEPFRNGISREQYNKLIERCGYDLSQPWDSPKNLALLKAIPSVYRHPSEARDSVQSGFYAVVGAGTAFDPNKVARYTPTWDPEVLPPANAELKKVSREDTIRGWPARTLMLVESRSREPWTKPVDIGYSTTAVVPRFGGFSKNGFLALTCDGAVHFVSDKVSPENLRAFVNRDNGGKLSIPGVPIFRD